MTCYRTNNGTELALISSGAVQRGNSAASKAPGIMAASPNPPSCNLHARTTTNGTDAQFIRLTGI